MGKRRRVRFLAISLISVLFFSGCGYKVVKRQEKRILFVKKIINNTLQPKLEIYLSKNLTQTIVNFPCFSLGSKPEISDYILTISLDKIETVPLFYSKQDSEEIVSRRFKIEGELLIEKGGNLQKKNKFAQSVSFPISKSYEEEKIMDEITRKIAVKIYSILMGEI